MASGFSEKGGLATPDVPRSRSRSRSPKPKKKKNANKHKGFVPDVKDNDIFNLPTIDYKVMLALTALAVFVRLYKIDYPTSVVFDEVHFGGFARKYIKGKFFMDVHPPLAKLLITLAGWLAGYDGNFDFKEIGKDYLAPGVPYVAMRLLPAIMGVAVVPIMYLTLKAAGCSTPTSMLGSGLILFENGLITQSRLILLDSPLLFFTALTGLSWFSFTNQHELGPQRHFSASWWFWLTMTGLSLGATASVKWVGLFTIAWVGALTALQLWLLLGDTKNVPARLWFKHLFARAACLIVIPVGFYMLMFAIHFICLVNPGDGDGFMSSEFQSTLRGKGMAAVPADVAYGSRVAIKHWNTQGGFLHSHPHMYPTGSKQQQITLYPHQDENNIWVFENETKVENGVGIGGFDAINPPVWIEDGAKVRLYHAVTDRRLHSHDVRPPVTEADWQFEVSAYGYKGFDGDANDIFRVEIIPSLSEKGVAQKRVRTIETKFKLVHTMTGCVLFSHKVKLPAWGYEQQEVTCARGATLPNSVWYVERNEHPQLQEGAEKVNYKKPGFLGKFWELNKVMWKTNAGLVESHAWDSRPPSWPILRRGINFWGRENRQVYLLGNPLIWWSSTVAIAVYAIFKGIAILRWQRGFADYAVQTFRRFDYEIGTSILAWALHYFPFYLMKRQLFLHHYFPALYFAVIALCQVFDFVTARIQTIGLRQKPIAGWILALVYLSLSIGVFYLYSPLAYGRPWTKAECKRVKLFPTWDFDCNTFHDSYEKYSITTGTSIAATPTPVATPSPNAPAQAPPAQEEKKPKTPKQEAPVISDAPVQEFQRIEKVEYRDQDGNLLDEEAIKALGDNVNFETRYETRYVDAAGEEVAPPPGFQDQKPIVKEAEPASPKPVEEVKEEAKPVEEAPKAAEPAKEEPAKEVPVKEEQKEAAPESDSTVAKEASAPEPETPAPAADDKKEAPAVDAGKLDGESVDTKKPATPEAAEAKAAPPSDAEEVIEVEVPEVPEEEATITPPADRAFAIAENPGFDDEDAPLPFPAEFTEIVEREAQILIDGEGRDSQGYVIAEALDMVAERRRKLAAGLEVEPAHDFGHGPIDPANPPKTRSAEEAQKAGAEGSVIEVVPEDGDGDYGLPDDDEEVVLVDQDGNIVEGGPEEVEIQTILVDEDDLPDESYTEGVEGEEHSVAPTVEAEATTES